MEENFATRLKLFMDSIKVPSSQFADSCEIPRPSFSQLLSGRNQKISDVLVRKIHAAYPDLSIMWLMFGEGSMLVKEDTKSDDYGKNPEKTDLYKSENLESRNIDRSQSEYSNLKGLNRQDNGSRDIMYQQLEENKKLLELQLQMEKMQKNPRRVVQITVYYDDSTFETFIPSK